MEELGPPFIQCVMRSLGQEAGSKRLEGFLDECLVQFANLGRLRNERLLCRLGVFRRELNKLVG